MQSHAYAAVMTGHDTNLAGYLAIFAVAPARVDCVDGLSTSAELREIKQIAAKFGLVVLATRKPGKSA